MPDTDEMQLTMLNGKWSLYLPPHRANRAEWTTPPFWEPERLDSMHRNIGPGDVVFDIGSEEADISALIQSWIGKDDGGVVLFEPNDRVWANARAIWEANDLKLPLAFVRGFAGDVNRLTDELDLDKWPESAYGPVISDHGFANLWERPDIPAIRIDDFVGMTGIVPSVLTIDVEGAEANVLDGCIDTLREAKPLIYCSVHSAFMKDGYDRDAQELHDYMGRLGYRVKHLATDHEEHWCWHHPENRELRL